NLCHTFAAMVTLFAITFPIGAHHSVASEYEVNKSVTLKGVVTRIEWQNPHIFYYVDVTDGASNVSRWVLEFGAPNLLYRAGWRRDSIRPGDVVTVETNPARYRPYAALLRMLTTSDGRHFGSQDGKIIAGSTGPEGENR